jgi:glycosyltransferase involved in cell wall biosynthesis
MRLHVGEELGRRGYRVDYVLLQKRGELLDHVPRGGRIVDLGVGRCRHAVRPIARYVRRERPLAVLAAMWPLTAVSIVAVRLSGVASRVVVSDHTMLSMSPSCRGPLRARLVSWSLRLLYPRADGIVAVSHGVAGELARIGNIAPNRIRVIYNPAFRREASAGVLQKDIAGSWLEDGHVRLIAVGSLISSKDYPTMLDAVDRLRRRVPVRLLVLGEGAERSSLEQRTRALGLESHVRMPGFVPDPRPYISHAHVFLLSSAWEGFGNVLVEALSSGTQVVSTDCPSGPREILADGACGRLTPVGDAAALADAVTLALREPIASDALRARAALFNVERATDQYLELLLPDRSTL